MKCSLIVGVALIAWSTLVAAQAPSQAVDPIIGTWKQNMARSSKCRGL